MSRFGWKSGQSKHKGEKEAILLGNLSYFLHCFKKSCKKSVCWIKSQCSHILEYSSSSGVIYLHPAISTAPTLSPHHGPTKWNGKKNDMPLSKQFVLAQFDFNISRAYTFISLPPIPSSHISSVPFHFASCFFFSGRIIQLFSMYPWKHYWFIYNCNATITSNKINNNSFIVSNT